MEMSSPFSLVASFLSFGIRFFFGLQWEKLGM